MSSIFLKIKQHYLRHLIIIFVIVLFAGGLYVSKLGASGAVVFKTYIGGVVTSTPTKVGVLGMQYPQAIVIDSQGNKFFFVDIARIQKYDINDNFVKSFGEYGTTTGKMRYIERFALDSQDNLYVTDGNGSKVLKFDNNGNFLFEFGSYDAGNANGKFQYPQGIAVDPASGNIYVSDGYRNDIQVFDTAGNYITKFGSAGSGDGQLSCPYGITFDPNNDIYVADTCNHRIQKFASSTHTFLSKFGTQGSGDGQLSWPQNIVFDNNGDLFTAEEGNNRIQKFASTTHAFISKFGSTGSVDGQINNGYGDIAIDASDNIYVAEQSNKRISKFDSQGNFIKKYESRGSGDGEFNEAVDIAVDSNKNSYVVDGQNYRIQKFDSNGNFLLKFGTRGTADGQFGNINGLAVDTNNNIYVIDATTTPRIQKFDSNGNFLLKFGSAGSGDGQFIAPTAIAIDPSTNNVYVSDTYGGNARIAVFDQNGNFIRNFGGPGRGDGQFDKPMGITVTPQGYVYVFNQNWYGDYNYHIQKFNLDGTFVAKQTYAIIFEPSANIPTGIYPWIWTVYIANDSFGNLYFSDYYNYRVVKMDANMNILSKISLEDKAIRSLGIDVDSDGAVYVTDIYGGFAAIYAPTPLLITSVSSNVSTSSATITWTSSALASSQVEYGPTTSFGTSTVETNTSPRVLSHTVSLSNLLPCTSYTYRVKSTNADIVTTIATSSTFTTLGCTNSSTILSSASIAASSTATSTVSNTSLALSIPPNVSSTSTDIVFQANKIEPVTFFAVANTPTGKTAVSSEVFHLTAIDNTNNSVISTFTNPVLVSITYPSLNGIDPNTLSIYRYDGSSWFPLSNCSTNTNTNTVSCYTTQFSDLALFAVPKPAGGAAYYQTPGDIDTYRPVVTTTNAVATVTQTPIQQAINSLNTVSIKFSRTLKRGMSGADVSTLQQYLSSIPGIYPEALITGYFGNLTYKAVQRYQCQYNIVCQGTEQSTGWGVVGPKTRAVFNR